MKSRPAFEFHNMTQPLWVHGFLNIKRNGAVQQRILGRRIIVLLGEHREIVFVHTASTSINTFNVLLCHCVSVFCQNQQSRWTWHCLDSVSGRAVGPAARRKQGSIFIIMKTVSWFMSHPESQRACLYSDVNQNPWHKHYGARKLQRDLNCVNINLRHLSFIHFVCFII